MQDFIFLVYGVPPSPLLTPHSWNSRMMQSKNGFEQIFLFDVGITTFSCKGEGVIPDLQPGNKHPNLQVKEEWNN